MLKRTLIAGLALTFVAALSVRAAAQSDEADRIKEAATVLEEIMAAPDSTIPKDILKKAEAIAVFPSTLKAGLIVGAQRGHGIISVRNRENDAWSAPAFMTLTGGSIGAQIGGQSTDIVLVVINRRGLENLLRNKFTIGADASVAAGPVGRDAAAATEVQMRAQILSYSRSRGLFAGVSVKGAALRPDEEANEAFYGKPYLTRDIVLDGKAGSAESGKAWRALLTRLGS